MRAHGKLHMFLVILAGLLISVMLVMMRLGGSVNFEAFMSPGRVYDFSQEDLQKSSAAWSYDKENEGYWLLKNKAGKRFLLDGAERKWSFLYITIDRLSLDSLTGTLKYYGKGGIRLYEQPITLTEGRNLLLLEASIPVKKLSLVFQDAQGEFVSISEMQIRTTPSWFTIPHFLELFFVVFAVVLVGLVISSLLIRRLRRNKGRRLIEALLESIQSGIKVAGDFLGSRMGGRLYSHQKESVRKFLFSLLFVWMMVGNVAGWLRDARVYRYHVLVCAILLLAISFISWEKPLRDRLWSMPLMKSWFGIWLGIVLCNFFVERKLESVAGYAMLIAGSMFVYFWQNMQKPDRMLHDLMEALEFIFFLGIVYCMVFRMKRPAIDYNGIFMSPEELAMYGVLMGIVFLTELDWLIDGRLAAADGQGEDNKNRGLFGSCLKNIVGGAAALFFVLRSGHMPGILIFALLGILYIPRIIRNIYGRAKECRIMFLNIIAATVLAYACVCIIFISTKYFPEILGMDVEYEKEMLLTELEGEEKEVYLMQYPGSLDGVETKAIEKLPIIWRNYARRLNLFGHSGMCKIFRRKILPYSGYLDMAYHHGLFILFPYMAYQISVIALGLRCAFRKDGRKNVYVLFLGIAYLAFSFIANVEIPWGHPLWLCFYLLPGYFGMTGKNTGKEEVV